MRPLCPMLISVALLAAVPAWAQTRPEPRLIFSIFAGVAGAGHLWAVERQPLTILGSPLSTPDTVRLSRTLSTGIIAGLSTTLFRSTHLGISLEAVYLGLDIDSSCRRIFEATPGQPDPRNGQVCDDITGRAKTISIVGFYAGGTYRFAPRGAISPYVRLHGGLTIRSSSVVETSGRFTMGGTTSERVIYLGGSGPSTNPSGVVAVGIMVPLASGYLLRLELADHLISMNRVTGPDLLANPPTDSFFDHVPALTISLDIVLEQRRGRRF